MKDQLNTGATYESTRTWKMIHIIHAPIVTRWMGKDDYDGQMIFGDTVGLKRPDICLAGEEGPRKNFTKLVQIGNRTHARYVISTHATAYGGLLKVSFCITYFLTINTCNIYKFKIQLINFEFPQVLSNYCLLRNYNIQCFVHEISHRTTVGNREITFTYPSPWHCR